MGLIQVNGYWGSWFEAGVEVHGASWARQTPAGHEELKLLPARMVALEASAKTTADAPDWISDIMVPAEKAWFVAQPLIAQTQIWLAAAAA